MIKIRKKEEKTENGTRKMRIKGNHYKMGGDRLSN